MKKLLLVEDDAALRALLADALRVEGYQVLAAASCADAQALWRQSEREHAPFDLALLDLGLPDGEGSELLKAWRGKLPLLVISARGQESGKIELLDAGADDYLVKPFAIGELLARIRVALRHRGHAVQAAQTQYRHSGLEVDLTLRRVRLHGADCRLTPTEYNLLARLVRSAGQVVTHRQLLADVWGPECTEQTHYLRLYMGQLRAKLEAEAARPQRLLTEPGVGYRLVEGEG